MTQRGVPAGSEIELRDIARADLTLQVVDGATGRPLPRAFVRMLRQRGTSLQPATTPIDGDARGVVLLSGIADDEDLTLAVDVEGYAPVCISWPHSRDTATRRVPMWRPATLVLTVRAADGEPAAAVVVTCRARGTPPAELLLRGFPTPQITASDGRWQRSDLAPGTYDVHADGGALRGSASLAVEVRATATEPVELRLQRR